MSVRLIDEQASRTWAGDAVIRVGSLFTGSGMLDVAVHEVLGAEPAWFVENDPAAAKVLAHHWPDVANHGDVTAVDWAAVEPVLVLTMGFPCQDVSSAGKRLGMRPGTRSGLWTHAAYAISQLRPELVVIENVRGLLSADAHCDLEPCPWCVGDDEGRPLRALGSVLGDLAGLGYDARWCGPRASDVGAPHGRFRIFITARPACADAAALRRWPSGWDDGVRAEGLVPVATADSDSVGSVRAGGARRGWPGSADHGQFAADANGPGFRPGGGMGRGTGTALVGDGAPFVAAPPRDGRGEGRPEPARLIGGPDVALSDREPDGLDWGIYGPAVAQWELILGRPAPAPTQIGRRGGQQLSSAFTEWLMGWPQGWVTAVPGLSRNDQLKICGNGVVPQQAVAALRWLVAHPDSE